MKCPNCSQEMTFIEELVGQGKDWREDKTYIKYLCTHCNIIDLEPAKEYIEGVEQKDE